MYPFSVNFAALESWERELSNAAKIIENGCIFVALRMKIVMRVCKHHNSTNIDYFSMIFSALKSWESYLSNAARIIEKGCILVDLCTFLIEIQNKPNNNKVKTRYYYGYVGTNDVVLWVLGINWKRSQRNDYGSAFDHFCGVEKLRVRTFQRRENHRKRINIRWIMNVSNWCPKPKIQKLAQIQKCRSEKLQNCKIAKLQNCKIRKIWTC